MDPYIEKMEKLFGKKLDALFNLLHKKPTAILKDRRGNIRTIIYHNEVTLTITKQGNEYILILNLPYRIFHRLKLPPTIPATVPEGFIDTTDPIDIIETFLASVRAYLTEFLR